MGEPEGIIKLYKGARGSEEEARVTFGADKTAERGPGGAWGLQPV